MPTEKKENKTTVDRGIMVGFWMPREKHAECSKMLETSNIKDANGKRITVVAKLGEMLIEKYMSKKA